MTEIKRKRRQDVLLPDEVRALRKELAEARTALLSISTDLAQDNLEAPLGSSSDEAEGRRTIYAGSLKLLREYLADYPGKL